MSYSIKEISKILGATLKGNSKETIKWLLTDSRSLNFPENTLFFAIETKRNSGSKYVPALYQRGVRNFCVSEKAYNENNFQKTFPEANFIIVPQPLEALQKLATAHRNEFSCPVVGITGSNGKTIVKEWLNHLLSKKFHIVRSPRSYNSQVGVPLSVWHMDKNTQLAIFEAGISEPNEMENLQPIIKPTIGVLTHIGGAHQENFFSLQEKTMEKLELFKQCDVIIYNGDDEFISNCIAKALLSSREIAWSKKDIERPLYISDIIKSENYTRIVYRYIDMEYSYEIPFIDDASIENSINCLAVCLYLLMTPNCIAERMKTLEYVSMRMEVKEGKNGCMIINDSYNSDLGSLDIALNFLHRRSESNKLKRTLMK